MTKGFFKELSNSLRQNSAQKPVFASKVLNEMSMPIKTCSNPSLEWETLESPRRLVKTYEFQDRSKMKEFVKELMDYEDKVNHHASILIEQQSLSIEIFTHSINSLTELDYEYAKMADMIHQDVNYYNVR